LKPKPKPNVTPRRRFGEFDLNDMRKNLEKKMEVREKTAEAVDTSCTRTVYEIAAQNVSAEGCTIPYPVPTPYPLNKSGAFTDATSTSRPESTTAEPSSATKIECKGMHESGSGDHVVASSANQKPTQLEMENPSRQIQHETSNLASTGKDCIPPETSDSIPFAGHEFADSKGLLDLQHTEIDKTQSVDFEPVIPHVHSLSDEKDNGLIPEFTSVDHCDPDIVSDFNAVSSSGGPSSFQSCWGLNNTVTSDHSYGNVVAFESKPYIYPRRKVGEFDLQSMRQNLEKKSELREKATEANNTSCTHSIFTVVTQQEDSVPADERTISSDQESDA